VFLQVSKYLPDSTAKHKIRLQSSSWERQKVFSWNSVMQTCTNNCLIVSVLIRMT